MEEWQGVHEIVSIGDFADLDRFVYKIGDLCIN